MNIKAVKIIAVIASGIGAAMSLIGAVANDKILDDKITTKVADAVANLSKEN